MTTAKPTQQGPPKAVKVAPKGKAPKATASKGRSLPTVPLASLKLDRRNPFGYETRIHAYFQAILDGKGAATVDQMEAKCIELNATYGITDAANIRHDLNNQTAAWRKGKWGLTVGRDAQDRMKFRCTAVKGVTWAEAVGSRRK